MRDVAATLDSPKFQKMFPRLVGYVITRLRFARMREPTPEEVKEVVQDVVAAALGGRSWRTDQELWEFLCGVVWNVMCNRARAERRRRRVAVAVEPDEVPEPPAPSSRRDALIEARERVDAIRAEVADDPELTALIRASLRGNETHPAIARALGCDDGARGRPVQAAATPGRCGGSPPRE